MAPSARCDCIWPCRGPSTACHRQTKPTGARALVPLRKKPVRGIFSLSLDLRGCLARNCPEPQPGPASPGAASHSRSLPVTGPGLRQSPRPENAAMAAPASAHGREKPAWPWLLSLKMPVLLLPPWLEAGAPGPENYRRLLLKIPLHEGAGGEPRSLGRSQSRPAAETQQNENAAGPRG